MRLISVVIAVILLGGIFHSNILYADDKQQLQLIRASIAEQEQQLAEQKKQREKLVTDLKQQETAIANLLTSIEKNARLLATLDQEMAQLTSQITELEKQQTYQQAILAKQLEHAFKLGKTSNMELIFSAKESERNERIITYYSYINREREQLIKELNLIQVTLLDKQQVLENKRNEHQQIQIKQQAEKDSLVKNQKNRQKTMIDLESSMKLNQQKLQQLRENETRLQIQITKAEDESRKIAEDEARQASLIQAKQQNYNYKPTKDELSLMARVSGIGKPKYAMSWPVIGSVQHRFGESQQGELRWKGLVIRAQEGSKVNAIADGRVILASWLQGYGFIVAIDHGKGDMSLYGYNQRVLVNVGDNIVVGQPIALVGTTGGQNEPALYFEIRRDGKALDPSVWLKK